MGNIAKPIERAKQAIHHGVSKELAVKLSEIESVVQEYNLFLIIAAISIVILIFVPFLIFSKRRRKTVLKVTEPPVALTGVPIKTIDQVQQIRNTKDRNRELCNETSTVAQLDSTINLTKNNVSKIAIAALDVDGFIRRLRTKGFQVLRLKNKAFEDHKVLRLTSKAYVTWSRSYFSKSQPLSSLVSVFESDGKGFIMEFKQKTLYFQVKESEYPFDAASIIKYFNAVIKKMKQEPTVVMNICKDPALSIHDDYDDGESLASDTTGPDIVPKVHADRRRSEQLLASVRE